MLAKPATEIGVTAASAPPQTMASTRPNRMRSAASPTAWAEAAQAVTVHVLGPRIPNSMAISPAAMLGIIIGHRKGLTRLGPRPASTSTCCSRVLTPPSPLP